MTERSTRMPKVLLDIDQNQRRQKSSISNKSANKIEDSSNRGAQL